MAKPGLLKLLRQGVQAWNRWAEQNPQVLPDLEWANLVGLDLNGARLDGAILSGARLNGADLSNASLKEARLDGADLFEAVLTSARLDRARLVGAKLIRANLQRATLSRAKIFATTFARVDLRSVQGLAEVEHLGSSEISVSTLQLSQGEIPEAFLKGCGFQDWEIAAARIYNPNLSETQVVEWQYQVIRLRTDPAFQFDSCFISYSHSDKVFAVRLERQLQQSGIRCWRDEKDMRPGERILDAVDRAVRTHDRILLCCSEASLNSWWVKDELRKALERERAEDRLIIVPLNLDGYLLHGWEDGLASELRSRLAADFTGWEADEAKFHQPFARVVQALRQERAVNGPKRIGA